MWLLGRTGKKHALESGTVRRDDRPRVERLATGAVLACLVRVPELALELRKITEQRAERGRVDTERQLLDP
jgi:hypothetical protein